MTTQPMNGRAPVLGREAHEPLTSAADLDVWPVEWYADDGPPAVSIECDAVGGLCPVTGQPDTYVVTIAYVPWGGLLVETKSLKLYLWGLRELRIGAEHLAAKIADELAGRLKAEVVVTAHQATRGGMRIKTTSRAGAAYVPDPMEAP